MIDHLSDEALSTHLDGALEGPDERQLASHLATCPDCAHRLEMLVATTRAISGLPGEQPPRPLDLSFLAPPVATGPRVIPTPVRWRPPAWAAPVLAAAAILLVAVTVVPGLLARGGASTTSSSQAGGSGDKYALAPAPGSQSVQPGNIPGGAATAEGAVPRSGSAPSANTPGRRAASQFAQAGGAVVELSAGQPSPRAGQALTLDLVIQAGSTVLNAQHADISVSRGNSSQQVAATGAETIAPGQAVNLSGTWVAGKLGSGPQAAGDYEVVGRVTLLDGSSLSVSFTIHVS